MTLHLPVSSISIPLSHLFVRVSRAPVIMKDLNLSDPTTTVPPPQLSSPASKKVGALASFTGYKTWLLAAIVLLAFWSMFTGSISLKLSSPDLADTETFHLQDDLDVLELEDREKVVRKMWEVYTQSSKIRVPRFWQQAFEAAYELLSSDSPAVRDGAVSEIAKLSLSTLALDLLPSQSRRSKNGRGLKLGDKSKKASPKGGT